MKSLSHHINTVKSQPHHIRKQVAFVAAAGCAVLIGIIWAGASLATESFALHGSSFADAVGASGAAKVGAGVQRNTLLAAPAAASGEASPAHIEIVDKPVVTPPASEPTVIPF